MMAPAERRRHADIAVRADQQHAWVLASDDRGVYVATDAASVFGEAVHPVRKPPALQFAVHERAWRTGE
jgi:hypothetical protein